MGVMILALDPDQESDFQDFGDSGSGSSGIITTLIQSGQAPGVSAAAASTAVAWYSDQ